MAGCKKICPSCRKIGLGEGPFAKIAPGSPEGLEVCVIGSGWQPKADSALPLVQKKLDTGV